MHNFQGEKNLAGTHHRIRRRKRTQKIEPANISWHTVVQFSNFVDHRKLSNDYGRETKWKKNTLL